MMQEFSYAEEIDPRLHIYPSQEADEQKRRLLSVGPGSGSLEAIGRSLLASLSIAQVVPIFVLRGGLALWQPYRQIIGPGPVGIIVPTREQHDSIPRVSYATLPLIPDAQYALLDVLVASGRTMLACLMEIQPHLPDGRLHIVAPFVATLGRDLLFSEISNVQIHCIWHAEQIDDGGRMVGPGFDVGNYVFGWSSDYLVLGDD